MISSTAVQAWRACVTQEKQISVTTDFHDTDQGTTGITLTFHKSAASESPDHINFIKTSENLACTGGSLNPLINKTTTPAAITLGGSAHSLVCSRMVDNTPFQAGTRIVYADDSYVTVATTAGEITRHLPAILPPAPPAFPRGTIVAWFSHEGPIPSGWALCDGTNGNPDLRDRFLMGTGQYPDVGKTGGTNQQTVSVSIDQLFLATGGTEHSFAMREEGGNGVVNHRTPAGNLVDSFTAPATKTGTFDGRPAYTAIMYIIKQ
jgi:hypothetical protein